MRITFLVVNLGCGGVERTVSYLSEYFAEQGEHVSIICISDEQFYDISEKVNLIKLNIPSECSGTIEVTRKAVEIKHNGKSFGVDDSNIDLCFKTCLKCSNKESAGCYSDPSCN